jgi:5'-nucleotidase
MKPLILVSNDDGIASEGLWALVEALVPLGQIVVAVPDRQWSGAGRSLPFDTSGRIEESSYTIKGETVQAYGLDTSPALCVVHGVVELTDRRPDLIVSGINFGVNLGCEVTVSGTVGAALEGACFGIPAIAVSQEMDPRYHLTGDEEADYVAAQAFSQRFARYLLKRKLPYDVDVLNINVPSDATPLTPWRLTRASRKRSFQPTAPDRAQGETRPRYDLDTEYRRAEIGSDIWALRVERAISVTPLSINLTARSDLGLLQHCLSAELPTAAETAQLSPAFATYPINLSES